MQWKEFQSHVINEYNRLSKQIGKLSAKRVIAKNLVNMYDYPILTYRSRLQQVNAIIWHYEKQLIKINK